MLHLQRAYGNSAVARLVAERRVAGAVIQRAPIGYDPAVIFKDWKTEIGANRIRTSLEHYIFTNTNVSDRKFTFEDEIEAAIDIDPAYLVAPAGPGQSLDRNINNLAIWQKHLRTMFARAKAAVADGDYDDTVRHLQECFESARRIYALPMQAPQFDVTWKKQVQPGKITIRHTGRRVEALFEVMPAGSTAPHKKNLNVSLRRHWWNGVDQASVANPAGNSLMGPELDANAIATDITAVAEAYTKHVSARGYGGEFGVDCPSGVHYHVNRLDNQQPHCFPNRGKHTVSMTAAEYNAAVALKLYDEATRRNHQLPPGVSTGTLRVALGNAPRTLDLLKQIRVGFAPKILKPLT
jgi:hypothetical protein